MSFAHAIQEMHVDLTRTVLHAKARARRSSKKIEQIVSQIRWMNSQTHSRSSYSIGSRRFQADRLHEGKLGFAQLQEYVATTTGFAPGELAVLAGHAFIDLSGAKLTRVREMVGAVREQATP